MNKHHRNWSFRNVSVASNRNFKTTRFLVCYHNLSLFFRLSVNRSFWGHISLCEFHSSSLNGKKIQYVARHFLTILNNSVVKLLFFSISVHLKPWKEIPGSVFLPITLFFFLMDLFIQIKKYTILLIHFENIRDFLGWPQLFDLWLNKTSPNLGKK